MLYEQRTYTLVPGGLPEYMRIYETGGRTVQTRILGQLVALLKPETGDLNQLVFLWAYDSFEQRRERRQKLAEDAEFAAFRKSVRHLLLQQESRLLSLA